MQKLQALEEKKYNKLSKDVIKETSNTLLGALDDEF